MIIDRDEVRPEWFGADRYDNTHDDTTAFLQAIDTGHPVRVSMGGKYTISDTLTLEAAEGETVAGTNGRQCIIEMASTSRDRPIIEADGEHKNIEGLRLQYAGAPFTPGAGASATAILATRMRWSQIRDVTILICGTGILAPNVEGVGGFFSNTVTKLRVLGFSEYALDMQSYTETGNTGSAFSNIYLANNPSGTALPSTGVARFVAMMETTLDQLNIEHVQSSDSPLQLTSCEGMSIRGLHFEGVSVSSDRRGFVRTFGERSVVSIDGMNLILSDATQATISRVFEIDEGISLRVGSGAMRGMTVAPGITFCLVGSDSGGSGATVEIDRFIDRDSDLTNVTNNLAAESPPILRRWNDSHYHLDTLYTAAP
jgi:hypothetical protein